jgi:hypothetical protein
MRREGYGAELNGKEAIVDSFKVPYFLYFKTPSIVQHTFDFVLKPSRNRTVSKTLFVESQLLAVSGVSSFA